MKYSRLSILLIGLLFCASGIFTSCSKLENFGGTNVNPNGSTEVLTSALLSNVEASLGRIAATSSIQPGLYCQYFAEPTYPGTSLYTLPQLNFTILDLGSANTAVNLYSGPLMDCEVIINKNSDPATAGSNSVLSGGANENQIAVAKILKSYIFWTITDRWGDIPYSEALKGIIRLTPKYDHQEDVYKGLITDLAEAAAGFNDLKSSVRGDLIYSGDIGRWKKLANSLRVLMALRLSKRYPGNSEYAATQLNQAAIDPAGVIESNADNFNLPYPGGYYIYPWSTAGASADNAVSKTFTDALTGLGDTRIQVLASNSNGVAYGLTAAVPQTPAFAHIFAPAYRGDNDTLVIISAAHVWLARAEAIELEWLSGDSKAAYESGIKASFAQWGLTMPAAYLTNGPANFDAGAGVASIGGASVAGSNAATPSKLARIALQQWIAFYPDGIQGWSNWRREEKLLRTPLNPDANGVPDLRPTINSKNASGDIVRRYVYGTTEYAFNIAQLRTAIAAIPGGDSQDGRVWWDNE